MKETLSPVRFLRWLTIGALLITFSIMALAGISIYHSRLQREERAMITSRNLSQVLDEYISGVISKIDVALLSVVDEAEKELAGGGINSQVINTYIDRQHSRIPELEALRMINAKGNVVSRADGASGSLVNAADRDYFIKLRNDSKGGIFISKPLIGRISGKWSIAIARRVNYPDGSFAGVVVGAISLQNFAVTFSRVNVGKHGVITLFDDAFSVVCRYPDPPGPGGAIGRSCSSAMLRELLKSGQTSATYRTRSSIDGVERMYSFRKISAYPLYEFVGLAKEDYLGEWRNTTAQTLGLVALFIMVVLCLAWSLHRYIVARKEAAEELRQRTEELEMMMETTPATIWIARDPLCKDIRGNKAVYELLQLPQDTNVSKSAADGQKPVSFEACNENGVIPPEDLPMQRAARTGEVVKGAEFEFRFADGRSVWIYGNAVPLRDSRGSVRGSLGAFLDITERKKMEQTLRESESRFRTAVESIPFDFWMMGKDGRYIMLNSTCIKNWGNILGKRPEELDLDADILSVWQDNNRRAFAGETVYGDVKFIVGGQERFFHNIIAPIQNGETIQGILGINIDITQRRNMEEALRRWNEALELRVTERTSELKTAHDRLRDLALHLQTVREEERTKIARDIHDEFGQALTAMKMDLSWFQDYCRDHKEIFKRTDSMLDRLNATILSVRRICTELRPSILDDFGLVPALEWQANEFEKRTGIGCVFDSQAKNIELDMELSTVLFRIFQEALTNVMKHAKATRVMARLIKDSDRVILEVIDNGKGIKDEERLKPRSFGLIGMRERVSPWGGEVEIAGAEGVGTTVRAIVPLFPQADASN